MNELDALNDLRHYISDQRKTLDLGHSGLTVCLVKKAVRKWNVVHDDNDRIILPSAFDNLVDGTYLVDGRAEANAELYINNNVIYYPTSVKNRIIKSYIESWEQRVPSARLHQLYLTDDRHSLICKYSNEQLAKDLDTVIDRIDHLIKTMPEDKPSEPVQTSLF